MQEAEYDDINIDRESLRVAVEESNAPFREQVVEIIGQQACIVEYYGDLTIDIRSLKLKKLQGGEV